ncbi:DUF2079 domain-containing protein [Micromonosporaceae bacterium Da 78-11]
MSVAAKAPAASADPPTAESPTPAPGRRWRSHLLVAVVALAMAVYVMHGLWQDPFNHVLVDNVGDQAFFEWILSYGLYVLSHGGDPFFTTLMNVPLGVNLAANTSVTVYAVLLAPVTKLAGPQVSFVTVLTLNLAGSAFAWYLFCCRWLVRNRFAAGLAGLFCGFAPGFISHANGHLNWTSGWVGPVVIWWLLKLREKGHWLRNGLVLGLLLAIGFSVAAEGLFFTALAGGLFLIIWSLARATRSEARAALPTVLAGLGVTAVVAGALLAYPLYMHFAGPQTFSGTGFDQRQYVEDSMAYLAYSDRTLAAAAGLDNALSPNRTEETSFFGVPLLLLVIGSLILLFRRAAPGRRATLRALSIIAVVFLLLSLGPRLHYFEHDSYLPMPYALLARLPLFDSALPARFALVLVGVFGIVLALVVDLLVDKREAFSKKARFAFAFWFALALVPIFPIPLLYTERVPELKFIADRTWERYVPEDGVMSALPFALNVTADGQRWQAYTIARGGRQFRIPDGYFLGPDVDGKEGKGRVGAVPRATDWLFLRAGLYGYLTKITNKQRAQARIDFQYWGLDAVFLADEIGSSNGKPLFRSAVEITATELLGPPERVQDVLVWRIRPGVDPVDVPTRR